MEEVKIMAYIEVVKRELIRFYRRPLVWAVSFFLPLVMCLLICLIFAKGSPVDLPVAVLDADNSEISRMFVRNLDSLPSCKIRYKVADMKEGHQLLTEGKVYAFFAIPKNFQADMYRMKQPQLLFYYNNQRILIGGIISKEVNLMVQSMLVGIDAKMRSKHGVPFDEAVKQANVIRIDDHIHSNPYFNYLYFLSLTAFGHIIQIHILLTSVWAMGTEFKYGTTKEWLKFADNSIFIAFVGKMTPYFVLFSILFGILFLVYFGFMGVPYNGSHLFGMLSSELFIMTGLSLGLIFIGINGNFRYALSNTAFYVAMGFAFAGVTFPVMSMPLAAKMYSAILPLNYWAKIMIDQSLVNKPVLYDLSHLLFMCCLMIIGLIVMPRVKKLANDEKRWYQL